MKNEGSQVSIALPHSSFFILHSLYLYILVRLQAKPPKRMLEDVIHHRLRVLARAGLEVMVSGGKGSVGLDIFARKDHLYLVDAFQYHGRAFG